MKRRQVFAVVRRVFARRPHVCDPREDPFFPDDVRCRCGAHLTEGGSGA